MATATQSHFMPTTPEEMESFLAHLSDDELRELADNTQQLEERIATYGPQNDDELHEWIRHELHLDIPRTSVCPDHDAPFTFVADVFFERCDAALLMANRGGGKTFMVAIIHWLNSRFKPGCVAADTPIDCPRDHRRYPMGVPISQIQPGQLVWTFNVDEFIFELKPVAAAMMTRFGSAIYKLALDDGGVVRATADHRFMRRDGSWAELRELKPGDSLMPLYRDWEPYVRIRPDATNGGGMVPEYKAVADAVWPERKGFHVDHVDERRENSEPENLQLLTASEHCQKTMKGRKVGKRRRKDTVQQWIDRTEDERDRLAVQISASLKDHQAERVITGEQRAAFSEGGRKGGSRPKPQIAHECEECGSTYYRQSGGRRGNGLCALCKKVPLPFNHKVISIEPDGCENVWDMEVEGNHNFVTAGVVLHNCESLTFGAVQNQSNRAYSHLKKWIYDDDGEKKPIVVSSLMSETVLRNGSKIEVLGSTPEQVNGPHPHKAHADEIELMRDDTWKESQPVDTPIATPSGWTLMGDLRLGDWVLGRDGAPTRVIKIKDYSEEDVYRVSLTDGRSTECCGDHLWTVAGTSQRHRGVWKVIRTSDMIESGLKLSSSYRYAIPQVEPIEFVREELPIDPYVLGVLLGDGHFGSNTAFRSTDQYIVEKVHDLLGDSYYVSAQDSGEYANYLICMCGTTERAFRTVPASLGLDRTTSHTKFIPSIYKLGWWGARLELLRGLLDTDGCAIEGSSVAQYATVSSQLAKDVRELVFSLGGRAILREKQFRSEWSSGTLYTLDISFGDRTMPFSLPRKVSKMTMRQRTLHPSIKSIEPSRRVRVRCIGVDNRDSTYLTNDYIVTHNSRNMTVAGMTRDGRVILPQDIMTSTRKGPSGRMQALIDEIDEAIAEGYEPPRAFYKYCIKETAHERPDCQMVDPALREARLVELGEDPCSLCDCNRVRKGKNEDGSARLLSDICGGDFFFSRGWQPPAEIKKQFRENDKDTFEVQQLCSKAELKYHYFGSYKDAHHAIRNFPVDPENGPIFTSTDWGGTNPHSVHWYQLLTVEVEVDGWTLLADGTYPKVRLKEGTIVCFDEIYIAEVGNDKLGDMVIAKENGYRQLVPWFRITERFADPQGKAARLDWKDKGLKCTWHITREFDEHTKAINSYVVDDDLFRIVGDNCPQWRREVKGWRKDEETLKQIDEDNHAMSDFRYAVANIKKLKRKYLKKLGASLPGAAGPGRAAPRVTVTTVRTNSHSPIGLREKNNDYARWRKSLGGPVSALRDDRRP